MPSHGEAAVPQISVEQPSPRRETWHCRQRRNSCRVLRNWYMESATRVLRFCRARRAPADLSGGVMKSLFAAVAAIAVLVACSPASAQSSTDVLQRLGAPEETHADRNKENDG